MPHLYPLATALTLLLVFASSASTLAEDGDGDAGAAVGSSGAVLVEWASGLPQGGCRGCADGPLFRDWTPTVSVCAWNWTEVVSDEDNSSDEEAAVTRGVLACNETTQAILYLDISGMNLTGPLPEIFSKLVGIERLDASDNGFSGTLPASWSTIGRLAQATHIALESNNLVGPLPKEWTAIGSLHSYIS
mmetsp:Transcript_10045/g.25922  ORF Transcript_10045/g.25922 Transcript_10045/m.25922 type:complete len:190 (-) Transcript_10045:1245-1814(-)